MTASGFSFRVRHNDSQTAARRSTLHTPRGDVQLPGFMPVGTQGTVKGLTVSQVLDTGAEMILSNAYHLALRPGADVIRDLGGLHAFSGWDGPILTDSGGFQIFSLADAVTVDDHGAVFRSHIDGRQIEITPERAVEIQQDLDCDIAMVLDHVIALPADADAVRDAAQRSIAWAARCRDVVPRAGQQQALFGIVQGGLDPDLRAQCAKQLATMGFDGLAVGGLSVGESYDEMVRTLEATAAALPADTPRYLMGVGRPQDILAAVARGIDLFDCVMPTRNGRNALAFTDQGTMRLRNERHQRDTRPLEADCPCAACRHSRGYLRHLFMAGEMLGPVLLSIHNLTYYQRLLAGAREAIADQRFADFSASKVDGWTRQREE